MPSMRQSVLMLPVYSKYPHAQQVRKLIRIFMAQGGLPSTFARGENSAMLS